MNGFLIDTNAISEFVKLVPEPAVIGWFREVEPSLLFASVVTLGEIRLGVENMAVGKRKADLEVWLDRGLPSWFEANLLPVTRSIADRWGCLTIQAKRNGLGLTRTDGLIAAVADVHELTLVTRNVRHFVNLGIGIVNPWSDPS